MARPPALVLLTGLWACSPSTEPDAPPTDATDTGDVTDPSAERGVFAGSLLDAGSQRDAFDATDPVEANNPNLIAARPGSMADAEEMDELRPDVVTPRRLTLAGVANTPGRLPWNGYLGRGLSLDFVQTAYQSNWPIPDGRTPCVPPDIMADCCNYVLTEGVDGSGNTTTYYSPTDLFATEADAAKALREVYAQRPIYLPYTDSKVNLMHGWVYNWDSPHGSLDYGKTTSQGEDPSFRVRAVAGGTVVAKYWDAWHGNVLVIEHPPAPGGAFTYRSFYFHLRNGKTNDINLAKTRTMATGDPTKGQDKYLLVANAASPSDLYWGTNSHAIPVNVGDTVVTQQLVAWSGNTGPGGASAGINTDGTVKNPVTMNNHLHFMLAVSDPLWTGGEWLYVDPYGVYDQQASGCYDLVDNTLYDRLFAPFYPYFHGVDLGVFNAYLYYYGQMGRSPATFSVQRSGTSVVAAGAFKSGLSPAWYVYDYMTPAGFDVEFDALVAADFRVTERSVTLDSQAAPRHNAVFRPDTIDDWYSFGRLALNNEYQDTFDQLVDDGYALTDFFAYHEGSTDRAAATFVPATGGFVHHAGLNSQAFKDLCNGLAPDGWLPVDVNVMELSGTTLLSALFEQTGDARMVHWGMSAAEYQQWTDFYFSKGWDLEVVQSYANGGRYAAIYSH